MFNTTSPWGAAAVAQGQADTVSITRQPMFASQQDRDAAAGDVPAAARDAAELQASEALEARGTASPAPAASPASAPSELAPSQGEGERELDGIWGPRADATAKSIATWLDSLPEVERQAVQADPRMNDPAYVQELAGIAGQPQPKSVTIEGVEAFMKSHPTAYRKSEWLGTIYRRLLTEREQAKRLDKE